MRKKDCSGEAAALPNTANAPSPLWWAPEAGACRNCNYRISYW